MRFSASTGLSGGEPLGECSTHDAAETMEGMNCASIPSFARSSGKMGRKSGEGPNFTDDGTGDRSLGGVIVTASGARVVSTTADTGSR